MIGCAGAWSDRLAVAAGAPAEPRIVPFRGAYLRLRPERRELVRASIYPAPDPELPFLGGHLTRGIDGEVLLGPSALMVGARDAYRLGRVRWRDLASNLAWPGTWRLAAPLLAHRATELRHAASRRAFVADLRRFVPELDAADVLPGPSGIRAQALDRDGRLVDDFVVHRTERALHVRNAPSPAATSSLALAKLIADQADERAMARVSATRLVEASAAADEQEDQDDHDDHRAERDQPAPHVDVAAAVVAGDLSLRLRGPAPSSSSSSPVAGGSPRDRARAWAAARRSSGLLPPDSMCAA